MKSYKNWKLVNESIIPLGIRQPNVVGGLQSPFARYQQDLDEGKKGKKMHDDDFEDDAEGACHCNEKKKMKKHLKDKGKDQWEDGDKTPVDDHSSKPQGGMPHTKARQQAKKKMKKMMGDEMPAMLPSPKKKRPPLHGDVPADDNLRGGEEEGDMDDDIVDDEHEPDEDFEDEGDEEEGDFDGDDEEGEEGEEGDFDDEDEEEGGDFGDDREAKKYGFMKKKMQKAMKKKMRESKEFAADIAKYPVPQADHSSDSEAEFFASLSRQFGNPRERFSSGLSEDLLLPLTDPNAPAVKPVVDEPGPGEVGYAPQGRIGSVGGYAESADYKVLKKYMGENAAKKLLKEQQ